MSDDYYTFPTRLHTKFLKKAEKQLVRAEKRIEKKAKEKKAKKEKFEPSFLDELKKL